MRNLGVKGVLLACVVMTLTAGCTDGSPPSRTSAVPDPLEVAREVKAAIKTHVDAYAARDPAKAASILAPDLVVMFHGEANVVGLEKNTAALKAQMSDPAIKLEVSDETVDVAASGDLAVYHATYRFTFTNPATKQPATEVGNWVAVFKRQPNGAMKISRDVISDTPVP